MCHIFQTLNVGFCFKVITKPLLRGIHVPSSTSDWEICDTKDRSPMVMVAGRGTKGT